MKNCQKTAKNRVLLQLYPLNADSVSSWIFAAGVALLHSTCYRNVVEMTPSAFRLADRAQGQSLVRQRTALPLHQFNQSALPPTQKFLHQPHISGASHPTAPNRTLQLVNCCWVSGVDVFHHQAPNVLHRGQIGRVRRPCNWLREPLGGHPSRVDAAVWALAPSCWKAQGPRNVRTRGSSFSFSTF